MFKTLLKNALFGLIVCVAVAGGLGSLVQAKILYVADTSGVSGVEFDEVQKSGETPKCILSVSSCPIETPNCGKEPLKITVSCLDPSCTPTSCVPAANGSGPSSARSSTSGNGGGVVQSDSCIFRQFTCSKNAGPMCFKRWHNAAISCSSSACTGDSCIKADTFFSHYNLEQWDLGPLAGPFPRSEILCLMQKSSCSPTDQNCVSQVSIEQVPCDDTRCTTGVCTKTSVMVDQTDSLISNSQTTNATTGGSGTSGTSGDGSKDSDSQQQNGDAGDGGGDSGDTNNPSVISSPVQKLGCFEASGAWTTDRTKCAANQTQFVDPNATTNKQEDSGKQKAAEKVIETKFIPDTRKSSLVQNLLSSTVEASGRLSSLLENPSIPDTVRQQAQTTLDALKTVQKSASDPDTSVRDLQGLADTVSTQLTSVQEATVTWRQKQPDVPVTITDKLDEIMKKIPSVLSLMQQSGIAIDTTLLNEYAAAGQIYAPIRAACMADANSCGDLSKVLDALDPLVNGIKTSLETAGRTDLEQKIDEMLQ